MRVLVTSDRPARANTTFFGQVVNDTSPHVISLGQLVLVAENVHAVLSTG